VGEEGHPEAKRAGFLEEESEPRTKRISLAGENQRADDPKPEPFLDNFPVKTYSRLIKERRRWKFK